MDVLLNPLGGIEFNTAKKTRNERVFYIIFRFSRCLFSARHQLLMRF